MTERASSRAAAAAIVLVAVWVTTYWMWEPSPESAAVIFDDAPPAAAVDPAPAVLDPLAGAEPTPAPAATDPAPPTADDPAPGRRVEPPAFREYIVRRGDQIMTISQRVYGTTRHWQAIAKANPDIDPMKLRAGQTLRVPRDPDNVQGVVVDSAGEPESPPAPEPETIEYIVKRNDSLWEIARSVYGDGTMWTIIRDANRDLVGDQGQRLRPGMTLRIPPAPRGAR